MRLFVALVIVTFIIGTVSALEIDNVKKFDSINNKVTIKNSFLGIPTSTIGEAQMTYKPESSCFGNYCYVELVINNFEERKIIDQFEFYEVVNGQIGKPITPNYWIKYYDGKSWKDYDIESIEGIKEVTIRVYVSVPSGKQIEWIPKLYGKRITEWTVFTGAQIYENQTTSDTSFTATTGGNWLGQSITIGATGQNVTFQMQGIQLYLVADGGGAGCDAGDMVHIALHSVNVSNTDQPNSSNILSFNNTVPCSMLNTVSLDPLNITMTPFNLTQGTKYAFNLSFSDVGGAGGGVQWGQNTTGNNSVTKPVYRGGNASRFNEGGGTYEVQSGDNWFIIYGDPADNGVNISVVLDRPNNGTLSVSNSITFNATITPTTQSNITNATILIYFMNGTLFNQTNKSVTGNAVNTTSFSISNFIPEYYKWNIYSCAINATRTICNTAPNNITLIYGLANITSTFDSNVYETDTVGYNITFNVSSGTPTGFLYYNGSPLTTNFGGLGGNNWLGKNVRTINNFPATKNLYWDIRLGQLQYNTTATTQSNLAANFTLCGDAPQTVKYINITFKNETTSEERTTATISSTWTYRIGNQSTINKTYSFINASENRQYIFCFNPGNSTITTDLDMTYDNAESQQRTYSFSNNLYTNITSNITLYLLPTIAGLFSPFQTITSSGTPLGGVSAVITRVISGTTVQIATGTTDSSGFITFFLNPDATYSAVFTLAGFASNTFSFIPTTDTRTVIMGATQSNITNGTTIAFNTSYQIFPINSTLNNNTNYEFAFNVTTGQTISSISMNITNTSGYQLLYNVSSSQGYMPGVLNTGNYTQLNGYFIINGTQEQISATQIWLVASDYVGSYSIYRQLTLYTTYGFKDFFRLIMVVVIIMGVLIFMSSNELVDSSESKVGVALLLIWAFSIVGWLNTGMAVNSTSANINQLGQLSNRYGIAILASGASVFFIFRRLFI